MERQGDGGGRTTQKQRVRAVTGSSMKPSQNRYQNPTSKEWISGFAFLLAYLLTIGLGAVFLVPKHWYWWLLIMVVSTVLLVIKQNRNYACRCRECGHEFEVSFLTNLISPHGVDKEGSWQWVKCPGCEKRAKASVIKVIIVT